MKDLQLLASTVILLMTLSGCASTAPNAPAAATTPTSAPTSSGSHSPEVSEAPTGPSGAGTAASNLVVDYASFANWDSIPRGANPVYEHQREGSKESICDAFFAANGLVNPEFENAEQSWKGQQIVDYIAPRLELAWQLNLDTTRDENDAVANSLLECLTSRTDSTDPADAHFQLSNIFGSYRGNSMQGTSPASNMNAITRESVGTWHNGSFNAYVVEYESMSPIGDPTHPVITFEWSPFNDFRFSSINNYVGGDSPVVWGTRPPVILDPSRADALYDLQ